MFFWGRYVLRNDVIQCVKDEIDAVIEVQFY